MKTVATYNEALRFLYGFVDYEKNSEWKYTSEHFNLDRFRGFLHEIGDPQEQGQYIHVAGTNGKGSVSAIIASVLSEAGLRTGLYTSPHLVTFRERIRINGKTITPDEVVSAVNGIKEASDGFDGLTFFEIWTALALHYFTEKNCDVTVAEVGLGGRLDSTNVITPEVSVITSIAIDHRGKLGDSPEQIAGEKAGIIKPGIPVVSAPQESKVVRVLESCTYEKGARFILVGRDAEFSIINDRILYSGIKWRLDELYVPLNGDMQFENTAVALAALEVLADKGFPVDEVLARRGIGSVVWPGRLQEVSKNPAVIVDGACNTSAMKAVREYISKRIHRDRVVAVVGMCKDKDVEDVLAVLGETASRFVLSGVDNPRALSAAELEDLSPQSVETEICDNPAEALELAKPLAGTDGLVLVTGSLYLVGEVLRYYGIGESDDLGRE